MSVPAENIKLILTSSATTGQRVSRVALDAETADLQSRALAEVMAVALGAKRLPMMIVDTRSVLKDPRHMSARGAGILGMMRFGRDHAWVLDDAMRLDEAALRGFLEKYGRQTFIVFGFTFMVWQHLLKPAIEAGIDLSNGILVHSGGWKKLVDEAVDNATFRRLAGEATGLRRIYNFYGMVEQIGSVFLEGENRLLYPPNFADVIIRDPATWDVAPVGRPGVIQVLSVLPRSYPGHSLLTEDLGIVHDIDGGHGGRMGKSLSVIGRVPRAELRGCSDVHAFAAAAVGA